MRACFFVAAFFILLASLPVKIFLRADLNRAPSYAAEICVYGFCLRFGGLIRIRRKSGAKKLNRTARRFALAFAKEMLRLPGVRTGFAGRVGTGDAAFTALCAGSLQTLLSLPNALCPTRAFIAPDFNANCFALTGRCILPLRGGDIIRAGMRAARAARAGRGGKTKWRNVPLKP